MHDIFFHPLLKKAYKFRFQKYKTYGTLSDSIQELNRMREFVSKDMEDSYDKFSVESDLVRLFFMTRRCSYFDVHGLQCTQRTHEINESCRNHIHRFTEKYPFPSDVNILIDNFPKSVEKMELTKGDSLDYRNKNIVEVYILALSMDSILHRGEKFVDSILDFLAPFYRVYSIHNT